MAWELHICGTASLGEEEIRGTVGGVVAINSETNEEVTLAVLRKEGFCFLAESLRFFPIVIEFDKNGYSITVFEKKTNLPIGMLKIKPEEGVSCGDVVLKDGILVKVPAGNIEIFEPPSQSRKPH